MALQPKKTASQAKRTASQTRKTVLFTGYAPVHFLCFLPVYELLRSNPNLEFWFSGGFRRKVGDVVSYDLEGFYAGHELPPDRIITTTESQSRDFDVVVCSHTSRDMFPRSANRSVQVFHGVSFKNYAVREKALGFDFLCLPGMYHADRFREQNLVREGGSQVLITGFSKMDRLANGSLEKAAVVERFGLDPKRQTILYAPTGDRHNSLETMGTKVIRQIVEADRWNLLIKPHDHPKNRKTDWFAKLAKFESDVTKVVRDHDVIPLLNAADLLLTDASSVATEYTVLDRPIVLLEVPKLMKGVIRRGGARDISRQMTRLGPSVAKSRDIVDVIAMELERPHRYSSLRQDIAQDMFYRPGGAAARVAAVIEVAAGLREELPLDVLALNPLEAASTANAA
jgi:hypothetical protein